MNTIYKATNKINGKSYIGFDSAWPKRMNRHLENSNYQREGKFYDAIRKHGWNNFEWEIYKISENVEFKESENNINYPSSRFIKEIILEQNDCSGVQNEVMEIIDTYNESEQNKVSKRSENKFIRKEIEQSKRNAVYEITFDIDFI